MMDAADLANDQNNMTETFPHDLYCERRLYFV